MSDVTIPEDIRNTGAVGPLQSMIGLAIKNGHLSSKGNKE